MTDRQAQFVHEENIRHLESKLRSETDPAKREIIKKILEEEKKRAPGSSGNSSSSGCRG